MKKLILSALLCLCFTTAIIAQSNSTAVKGPAPAVKTMKNKYPNATNLTWKQEKDKYVAQFTNSGSNVQAYFDNQGNFIETHTAIAAKSFPAPVQNTVGSEFKGFPTSSHSLIETAGKETFYKVIVDRGNELIELRIDTSGSIQATTRTAK